MNDRNLRDRIDRMVAAALPVAYERESTPIDIVAKAGYLAQLAIEESDRIVRKLIQSCHDEAAEAEDMPDDLTAEGLVTLRRERRPTGQPLHCARCRRRVLDRNAASVRSSLCTDCCRHLLAEAEQKPT